MVGFLLVFSSWSFLSCLIKIYRLSLQMVALPVVCPLYGAPINIIRWCSGLLPMWSEWSTCQYKKWRVNCLQEMVCLLSKLSCLSIQGIIVFIFHLCAETDTCQYKKWSNILLFFPLWCKYSSCQYKKRWTIQVLLPVLSKFGSS